MTYSRISPWLALTPLMLAVACSENQTPIGLDAGFESEASDCLPNLDGRFERREMPTRLNTSIEYLMARHAPVTLAGNEWDLFAEVPGEERQNFAAYAVEEFWFADSFPAGSIVVPLDRGGESLGIVREDESSIQLLGLASRENSYTLLSYATPIDLFRFPFKVGKAWSSGSVVTGTFQGVAYNGSDDYTVEVKAKGTLSLPHLRFTDAYRVHTTSITDTGAAGVVVTRQQSSFVSECFGEVARATSAPNEAQADFTSAAELWRFGL